MPGLNGFLKEIHGAKAAKDEPSHWKRLAPHLVAFLEFSEHAGDRLVVPGEIKLALVGAYLEVTFYSHEEWLQKQGYLASPENLWQQLDELLCATSPPWKGYKSRRQGKDPNSKKK